MSVTQAGSRSGVLGLHQISNMADKYDWKKCSYVFRGTFVHSTPENVMKIMKDKIMGISLSGKVSLSLA